jgi:phage terminase Nu1 subunit (DNA packaging protein)
MIVNKTQLAQIIGRSEEWLTQAQKQSDFPVLQKGRGRAGSRYETADVIDWMNRKNIDNLLGDAGAIDIEEAKRRKLAAEAALLKPNSPRCRVVWWRRRSWSGPGLNWSQTVVPNC